MPLLSDLRASVSLWFNRLFRLAHRDRFDRDMAEEMAAHLDEQMRRNLAAGMAPDDARAAARRQFGGVAQIQERVRDGRRWMEVANASRDLRFAVRALVRAPGFAMAAVATLALGIGIGAAVFTFVHTVVRSPLRVPQPGSLVRVWSAVDGNRALAPIASWPVYERLVERRSVFASVGASVTTGFTYSDADAPMSVGGVRITTSLLGTLGAPLSRGRLFSPAEEARGGPPVVIVSPGFWRNSLGGREDIIGRTIVLDGVPHEVVGVVAEAVAQLDAGNSVWLPRPFELPGLTQARIERGGLPVQVTGRLQPGVTMAQANAELQSVLAAYRESFPTNVDVSRDLFLRSYADEVISAARPAVLVLLAAAACVLLIALSNVGSLCVTRALHRRQDVAVRLALGGSTLRVGRVLVAEVVVLAGWAGALGLLLAYWGIPAVEFFARPFLPRLPVITFDASSWWFVCAATAVSSVTLATIPILQVARAGTGGSLRPNRSVTGSARVQGSLVTLQVAVTAALLLASAVLLTSYRRLSATSPGFDAANVMTCFVNLPAAQYPTAERQIAFFNEALDRVRDADGSLEIALVSVMPLTRELRGVPFRVADRPAPPESEQPAAIQRGVSEDYFRVMRVPVLAGRGLSSEDRRSARAVCVINESFARRLFGTRSPLGRMLLTGNDSRNGIEIVGVVGDVRANGLAADPTDEIYRPINLGSQIAFAIRSTHEPAAVKATVARAVQSVDPLRSVAVFQTAGDFLARSSSSQRLVAWTTGLFSAAAITLAGVGLYGLLACWIAQRRRELGVRIALGADRSQIRRLVLTHGMKLVALGLVAGTGVYLAAHDVVSRTVFGVSATDPATLCAAIAGFLVVALLACWLPARRATKVDPIVALRAE